MKRKFLLLACAAAAVLAVALPAAANHKPTTGERISLLGVPGPPPEQFAADTPFHILHGWVCPKRDEDKGCAREARSDFDLYLDGALQDSSPYVEADVDAVRMLHLTNYPDGLPPGEHLFVGVWTNEENVDFTQIWTITFN